MEERKTYKKGRFTIYDETFYEGWWDGETWNGFATPCFEREEGVRILRDFKSKEGRRAEYDPVTETFRFRLEDEEEFAEFEPMIINDGIKVWPIGAYSWIWGEAD